MGLWLVLIVFVSGCGTDVSRMLEKDSALYWEADDFVSEVEDMNLGLEAAFYRAELEKIRACKRLYKSVEMRVVRELHEGSLSFGDRFVYDAKLLIAFLMPLRVVEQCRIAIEHYRQEYENLKKAVPLPDDASGW